MKSYFSPFYLKMGYQTATKLNKILASFTLSIHYRNRINSNKLMICIFTFDMFLEYIVQRIFDFTFDLGKKLIFYLFPM